MKAANVKLEVSPDLKLHLTTSRLSRSPLHTYTPIAQRTENLTVPRRATATAVPDFLMNKSFDNTRIRSRAPTSEPSSRRLIERISDLEHSRKLDQERIKELTEEIRALEVELDRLRSMSKQALEEQEGADLHALYHELFLTDLRKQVDTVNKEASAFRFQSVENRRELDGLRRECFQQKALLKRYREYVAESYSAQTQRTVQTDTTSLVSGTSGEQSEEKRKLAPLASDTPQFLTPPTQKTLNSTQIKLQRLQALEDAMILLTQSKDISAVCSSLAQAAKKIVPCQSTAVYLVDSNCVSIYSRGRTPHQLYKFSFDKFTIVLHSEPSSEPQTPLFTSLSEVSHGIRNYDSLILPVALNKRVLLILQCSEKSEVKRHGFIHPDEAILRLLCSHAAQSVQVAEARDREEAHRQHVIRVLKFCSRLFSARTHQNFANRLRQELPDFLEFEQAGVVFFDAHASEFFTLTLESGRGSSFTAQSVRFPINLGLTGEVFAKRTTYIMDSAIRTPKYNAEIDNASGAQDIRNMMLGSLISSSGKFVGVLQVANKKNKAKITDEDKIKMESILPLLADIIESANEVLMCMEVTTVVKSCLSNVTNSLAEADEATTEIDSNLLYNQISAIRSTVSDWSKKHTKAANKDQSS